MKKEVLSVPEWAIMEALWGSEPKMLSEIIADLEDKMDWKYQTYASYMSILCKKGFVGFRLRGRNKFYYALMDENQCIEAESNNILEKMNRRNAEKLLACMIRKTGLNSGDKQELAELIERLSAESEEQ